jgi:hypothetical protein
MTEEDDFTLMHPSQNPKFAGAKPQFQLNFKSSNQDQSSPLKSLAISKSISANYDLECTANIDPSTFTERGDFLR